MHEPTYDNLDKDPTLPGNVKGKVFQGVTGGFLGITDKYWASAVIPDQAATLEGRFSVTQTPVKVYQADVLGEGKTVEPGCHRRG